MRLLRALPLVAAILVTCALPALADDFKIPPAPDHHVVDNAGVLSDATRTSLENELTAYETSTGHQIVVWIGQTTGQVPLETWTVETANKWKIGRKGQEDGAVLFLFMQDHKARIEVGYGLEGKLPDASAHTIITDDIVPRMKADDPNGAVASGVAAMLATITPSFKSTVPVSQSSSSTSEMSPGVAILIFLVVVLFILFIAFVIIMQVVGTIRYGYLVMREGQAAAAKDMRRWWFWGGVGTGAAGGSFFSSGGGGGFGGGGGGFSGGGGSFGGGGASGGW